MSTYHTPEDLGPDQDERDAAIPGRRFFVYVLDTSNGHYVGHTARLRARMREHMRGEVESTAGTGPRLVWRSGPFDERHDAARFEAALKSMRDAGAPRFAEITGQRAQPFTKPVTVTHVEISGVGKAWKPVRRPFAVGAALGVALGLLWAFDFDVTALGEGAIKVAVMTLACAVGLPILLWIAPRLARVYTASGRQRRGYRRRRRR